MPIRIDNDLPAKAALEEENVFVMDKEGHVHRISGL